MSIFIIDKIDDLKELIEEFFIQSEQETFSVPISCELRRPLREFKTLYPGLHYFAYGLGLEFDLKLSKTPFKIDFHELTAKTQKTFFEDSGLHITDMTTSEMRRLLPYVNLKEWMLLLSDALLLVGGEKEFDSRHFDLEKQISTQIEKHPLYPAWKKMSVVPLTSPYKQFPYVGSTERPIKFNTNATIFTEQNNDRCFLSIDLKGANFQMLHLNGLIAEASWEEHMARYISSPYFAKSKKLRMRTLSAHGCYPAKQKILWENAILTILDGLIKEEIFAENYIAVFNGDEIVFHLPSETEMLETKAKCLSYLASTWPKYRLNVEVFRLKRLGSRATTGKAARKPLPYVKINLENGKVTFKCIHEGQLLPAIDLWENTYDDD